MRSLHLDSLDMLWKLILWTLWTFIQTLFRVEEGINRGLCSDKFAFDPNEDTSVGELRCDNVGVIHA